MKTPARKKKEKVNSSSKNGPRVRSVPKHRTLKLTRQKLKQTEPLPGAWKLFKQSLGLIFRNKKLFLGIAFINAVLSFVFVQGFGSNFNLVELKQNLEDILQGNNDRATNGVALFTYLLGSTGGGTSDSAGAYQLILGITVSLATIWAVRQLLAKERPTLKLSFYRGMYPFIPFLLLLIVLLIQLLPLLIGNLVYSTITQNGLAVTFLEKFVWLMMFLALGTLSLYMLASSLFSLYIVTLPEMTPLKALRSARELVLHRRRGIALRIIALPILLLLIYGLIFIPLIIFVTVAAQPLFLLVTSLSLVLFHVYMYLLYRSLL